MTERNDGRYILFVDDETQGLQNHEHKVHALSLDEAMLIGQDEFPYGIIRSAISGAELDEANEVEVMRFRAMRKRAEDQEVLTQALASIGLRLSDDAKT